MNTAEDKQFVERSLDLAAKGIGLVSPNPLVGCVIVSADGEVIGEGTYIQDNVVHAEAIALKQAGERSSGGTAYVSLEPHDHHGKTPPCTEALINAGIVRVVCPIEDPNPLVSGRGFATLRNAGVKVDVGLLADEASKLNEKFICWHQKQRPFVHLKLAMSLDGRISAGQSVSTALSGNEARAFVQNLRHEHDAILVGGNTVVIDDPKLTDRSGKPRRRPLVRVVLDNRLRTDVDSEFVATAKDIPTILFTSSDNSDKIKELSAKGISVVESIEGGRDLNAVLQHLKSLDIQSVLVEGGGEIAGAFVDARLVDKVTLVIAPLMIGGHDAPMAIGGEGIADIAQAMSLSNLTVERLGNDIIVEGYPKVP